MSTGRFGLLGIQPQPEKRSTSGSIGGLPPGFAAAAVALPGAISAPGSASRRAARSSPGEKPRVVAIRLKRRRERSIAGLLDVYESLRAGCPRAIRRFPVRFFRLFESASVFIESESQPACLSPA